MFYSETLLSKTGPLAQVWLSANLERKLTKSNILQSKIESSVGAIVAQNQAPLALRLSGQLLLGVVRIYSRKARYLLDDCNEALMKIKMAFRPGNVDLPVNAHPGHAAELTLPDKITPHDLLLNPAMLNFDDDILSAPGTVGRNTSRRADITLDNDYLIGDSQLEVGRGTQLERNGEVDMDEAFQLQDPLMLDIGDDMDFYGDGVGEETGVEVGRDAPAARDVADDLFSRDGDGDLTMKMGADDADISRGLDFGDDDDNFGDQDLGNNFAIDEEEENFFPGRADSVAPADQATPRARPDILSSPVSSARSSAERHLAENVRNLDVSDFDPLRVPSEPVEEDEAPRRRQIKKRKIAADEETEIRNKQFKAQQEDRSRILREPSFLPRDPTILSLLAMQRSGGFASSVFYPKNVHPDLAKLLSPEFVREMASRKRKRALEEEAPDAAADEEHVQLDVHDDEPFLDEDGNVTVRPPTAAGADEQFHVPADEDFDFNPTDDSFAPQTPAPPRDGDDDAEADPALPPPEIVSQATTHAVHLLRERFTEPSTQSSRSSQLTKESIAFTTLFPPAVTTRADATKMFFEVLVLATKDAVHVTQQQGGKSGARGQIEVRGKKALWGMWAEHGGDEKEGEMGGAVVSVAA